MISLVQDIYGPLLDLGIRGSTAGYFVKAALIFGLVLGVLALLRSKSPAVRSLVVRAGLAGVIALTILTLTVPTWSVAYPEFVNMLVLKAQAATATTSELALTEKGSHWYQLLFAVWLSGILLFGLRYLFGIVRTRNIVKGADRCTDNTVLLAVDQTASQLGISSRVECRISQSATVPMAWWLMHPIVILPTALRNDMPALKMVVAHELAHVKRNDIFWLNIASVLAVFHWFNPLVWIVRQLLMKESEFACDDFVLTTGASARDYASHLLESALQSRRSRPLVQTSTAYTTQLEGRIMSILTNRTRNPFTDGRSVALAALSAMVVMLPLALFTFQISYAEKSDSGKVHEAVVDTTGDSVPSPNDFIVVDSMPEMTYEEPVKYPDEARKAGVEGNVMIRAFVTEKGVPLKVSVLKSSGDSRLDRAAVFAAKRNEYRPAYKDNKPIGVWISYKVKFVFSDKK
jgi:TonB family protein